MAHSLPPHELEQVDECFLLFQLNFGTVLPTTPNKTQLYLISATMPTNVDTLLEHIIRVSFFVIYV